MGDIESYLDTTLSDLFDFTLPNIFPDNYDLGIDQSDLDINRK